MRRARVADASAGTEAVAPAGKPRLGWLETLAFWVALAALVGLVVAAGYLALDAAKGSGGVAAEAWRILATEPMSLARALDIVAVALVAAPLFLAPIALAETRSLRRYARREEELRRQRPDDVVTPYVGDEGEGVAFDGPAGRLLLLRPERGLGLPREILLPSVVEPGAPRPPSDQDLAQGSQPERTSPSGS